MESKEFSLQRVSRENGRRIIFQFPMKKLTSEQHCKFSNAFASEVWRCELLSAEFSFNWFTWQWRRKSHCWLRFNGCDGSNLTTWPHKTFARMLAARQHQILIYFFGKSFSSTSSKLLRAIFFISALTFFTTSISPLLRLDSGGSSPFRVKEIDFTACRSLLLCESKSPLQHNWQLCVRLFSEVCNCESSKSRPSSSAHKKKSWELTVFRDLIILLLLWFYTPTSWREKWQHHCEKQKWRDNVEKSRKVSFLSISLDVAFPRQSQNFSTYTLYLLCRERDGEELRNGEWIW